ELMLRTRGNTAPLSDLISSDEPRFLFGDLGSGKSTLVATYAVKAASAPGGPIPILVTGGFFLRGRIETVGDLADALSEFVTEQIAPRLGRFDLVESLQFGAEFVVVSDGLDELDQQAAQRVVVRLADLHSAWAGLRVLATGRPIELRGLDYSRWQCLELRPLALEERREILVR